MEDIVKIGGKMADLKLTHLGENKAFKVLIRYLLIFVLASLFVVFIIATGGKFLSVGIIQQILTTSAYMGVMSIGFAFALIAGKFDLTPGGTAGLAAMFGAWLVGYQQVASGLRLDPVLGILIALLVGAIVGLVNGILINKLKLADFLTTLAMLIALTGLTSELVQGEPQYDYPADFNVFGKAQILGIPIQIFIVVIFLIIAWFILKRTTFGAHVYLSGDNEPAARAMGINVDRVRIICFIISGFAAALGGLMIMGRVGSVRPALGEGLIFYIFAAAVIGGVSLKGGTGAPAGIWGGAILFSTLRVGFDFLGLPSEIADFSIGVILLLVLVVDVIRNKMGI